MRTRVDERLVAEAERFAFRFACDECVHFDADGARCSLGYPAAPRRDALARAAAVFASRSGDVGGDAAGAVAAESGVELCKSFELA